MDCNKCKLEIANLFDQDVDKTVLADAMAHIQQCADCKKEYEQTQEVLTILKPELQPGAPFLLKQNVINYLTEEERNRKTKTGKSLKLNSNLKKVVTMAAIITIIMVISTLFPTAKVNTAEAANSLIESSINASDQIQSMVMKLKVRTLPHDNFALVGTEYGWVEHSIVKSFKNPVKWRIDKGDRVVMFNGTNQYMWLPKLKSGYKAGANANFAEWFKMLLNPESILKKEKNSTGDKDSEISLEEKNGETYLNITSKAQGNFINDYTKNKSIAESDNRREYVFDSNTKLIKSLKIYILDGNKETLILETENINYNVPIDTSLFSINSLKGYNWTDLTAINEVKSETLSNVTSKRAAEIILNAMSRNNWDAISAAFYEYNPAIIKAFKTKFGGLKVVKIGEPFKSGLFVGEFVPAEVILNDGRKVKITLALRNDNKNKVWMVDGGL